MNELNPYQMAAVLHKDGPALVVAGAGAGKTKTLIARVRYLVEHHHIPAQHITAITFTSKAANEMRERLAGSGKGVYIGTFHRLGMWLITRYGQSIGIQDRSIISSDQAERAITELLKSIHYTGGVRPGVALRLISKSRISNGLDQDTAIKYADFLDTLAWLVPNYERFKAEQKWLDFDDLLLKSLHILKVNKAAALKAKERTLYTLVDEYQDTNPTHEQLITTMQGGLNTHLMAVGDPDQSIYAFNGSDIRNIMQFTQRRPNAALYTLPINYRSQASIVQIANSAIQNNTLRKDMQLQAHLPLGEKPQLWVCQDAKDEATLIGEVAKQHGAHYPYEEMAVLSRTSAAARLIEEAMLRFGIPYQLGSGVRFYDRAEIKTMLSLLRISERIHKTEDLERVLGAFLLSKDQLMKLRLAELLDLEKLAHLKQLKGIPKAKNLKAFCGWLSGLHLSKNWQSSYEDFLAQLKEPTDRYLKELAKGNPEGVMQRQDNLIELGNALRDYQEENPEDTLEGFMASTLISGSVEEKKGVLISTVHSAKGLEWRTVVVTGIYDNNFPSWGANTKEAIEEERRLFYVALTRAKEKLLEVRQYQAGRGYQEQSVQDLFEALG